VSSKEVSATLHPPAATVCPFCGSGCSTLLYGGASHPRLNHPVSQGALCLRGWSAGELLSSPLRVSRAYRRARGDPLQPVPVETALDEVIDRLRQIRETRGGARIGILGSARITVEEVAQLRRLARALGTARHSVTALGAECERLERAVTAQERIIAYRQSARWWFSLPWLRLRLWWQRVRGE